MGLFTKSVSNVAILGSSGNVGAAVVQVLGSKYPKLNVVAGVRDVSAEKSQKLNTGPNVIVKEANLSKPETLVSVLQGADVAFINTPGDIDRLQLAINGINAAKEAGVKHVVVVSVLTADHTNEIFGKQFTPLENHVKKSGLKYTILRVPFFIDNYWGHLQTIKAQGKFYAPVNPNAQLNSILVADIGEAAAIILNKPSKHHGKTYRLVTKTYSHANIAENFSRVTQRQVDYVQVPYEVAKQSFLGFGYAEWQVDGILELFRGMDRADPTHTSSSNDFKKITGHQPTTLQQWVDQVGAAFK